jgi:hypothetical protein
MEDSKPPSKREAETAASKFKMYDLVRNPRIQNVRFDKARQGFIVTLETSDKGVKYKGITSILKDIFWPNYVYKKRKFNSSTGAGTKEAGMARGKLVHQQLACKFNKSQDYYSKKYPNEELHTTRVVSALAMHKIRIIEGTAEFPIYDEGPKIATAIDALGIIKSTNELVVIDWKIGFDDYERQSDGILENPKVFKEMQLSDAPIMQAFIQIIVEIQILERRYGISIPKGMVIQATSSGVKKHEIPSFMMEHRRAVYDCVIEHMEKLRLAKLEKELNKGASKKRKENEIQNKEKKEVKKTKKSEIQSKEKKEVKKRKKIEISKEENKPKKTYFSGTAKTPIKKEKKTSKKIIKKEDAPKKTEKAEVKVVKVKNGNETKKTIKPKKRKVDPDLVGISFPESY